MTESPSATKRRQQHERQLERVGRTTPKGQTLLEQWAAEDRDARRGRVPARRSRHMANTSILDVASVSRGKPNGRAPDARPVSTGVLLDPQSIDLGENIRTDVGDLVDLVESVRQHGVLEPIGVRHVDGVYRLIFGQRRVLAAREAGLTSIAAVLVGDVDVPVVQLVENLVRRDLNALDEGKAIKRILEADPELTQAELAKRIGRSEPWVSNALRLLELHPDVQQLVVDGKLSGAHAKAIAGLKDPASQVRLATNAVQYEYSARQVESQVGYQKKTDRSPAEQHDYKHKKSERYAKTVIKALEAGNVPKDAQLLALQLWELDEKTVNGTIKAAGWTGVGKGSAVGSYGYQPDEIGCDCSAYRYRDYPKPASFERCCVSQAHVDAWKGKVDGAAKQRQKELADKAKRLTIVLQRGLDAIDATTARLTIVAIAGRAMHDLIKGQGDPWMKLEEIPDEQLGFELGELIAHRLVAGVDAERDYDRFNSAGLNTVVNRLAAAPPKKGKIAAAEPVEAPA